MKTVLSPFIYVYKGFLVVLKSIFSFYNKNFKFITILGCMSVVLGLIIAYYSGHVFGWVSPMMYLVMFLALLICIIYDNCEVKEKVKKVRK